MPFQKVIQSLSQSREPAIIERQGHDDRHWGVVLGLSDQLVLIAEIISNQFNGFTVISIDDVTEVDWGTPTLLGRAPTFGSPTLPSLKVDLSHWTAVLTSLSNAGVVMSIYREGYEQSAEVSRNVHIDEDLAVLTPITVGGEEGGSIAIDWSDVTKVEFRGSYEEGFERALRARQ